MTEEKLLMQPVIQGRCPVVAVGRRYGDGRRRQDPTESTSQKGTGKTDSGQTMGYPLCARCTSPLVLLSSAGNAHQHLLDSLTTQGS